MISENLKPGFFPATGYGHKNFNTLFRWNITQHKILLIKTLPRFGEMSVKQLRARSKTGMWDGDGAETGEGSTETHEMLTIIFSGSLGSGAIDIFFHLLNNENASCW